MQQTVDAIYENGAFRPLQPVTVDDGQRVHVKITCNGGPDALQLAAQVYDGLFDQQIDEIEQIALDRSRFFGTGSAE